MIALATLDGEPFRLYVAHFGEILSYDGRRVDLEDAPRLICASASQAIIEGAALHKDMAWRWAREARELLAAFEEARAYRAAQQAARRIVARRDGWAGK